VVEDNHTGERRTIPAHPVRLHRRPPNARWLQDYVADDRYYVLTGGDHPAASATSALADRPSCSSQSARHFAVGDGRSGSIKRVAAAVGEG
jgi:thioredoxin reductase (NADPH)